MQRLAIVASAALLGALVIAPSPGSADPGGPPATPQSGSQSGPLDITQVQHRLDVLNRQAEIASEAANTVRVTMAKSTAKLTGLQADVRRQRNRVVALRNDIVGAALSDYRSGGGLSTSASFLLAKRPSEFINALATSAVVEHQQASLLTQLTQQRNQLGVQEQQAARELAAIGAERRQLAAHQATLHTKIKQTQQLLGRLKERQRQRLLALQKAAEQAAITPPSRDGNRPPVQQAPSPPQRQAPPPPSSGRASIAVQTALAQIGKPYVYGAAGPNAFDCSGLTMYSWAAAGVSLSHASSVQSGQGVPVSISDLQPGDLVFYYSPVSHVAMYIGNGQVVHAPHTGTVVQIAPLYSMPISWARRVG